MLTEDETTEMIAQYLRDKGYIILQQLTSTQKGIDIIAESPEGIRHHIEVKGETSKNLGSPLTESKYGRMSALPCSKR